MVAAENELLQELPYKMWTYEPVSVRAYELCRQIEEFDYQLLSSDKDVYQAKDDWVASCEICLIKGFKDAPIYAKFADAMPIRCYIVLGAVLAFCENMNEFNGLCRWAQVHQERLYERVMMAVREAAANEDNDAIRLALYLLRPQDLRFLANLTVLDLSRESNAQVWLTKLAALPQLRDLNLAGATPMSDQLSALRGLNALETLDLSDTDVGNPDIPALTSLPALRKLVLTGTAVNDGIQFSLAQMPWLKEVVR